MNFFRRTPPFEPTDLDEGMRQTLAQQLRDVPALERPANEFAPRQPSALRQMQDAIDHIESFMALPMQSIDETMAELTAAYNETLAMGQAIRDTMMRVRADYLAQIERQRKLTLIAKETFADLAEKCAAIDAPKEDEPIIEHEAVS